MTPPRIEDLTSEPDDDELVHHFRKAGAQNTESVANIAVAGAVPPEPVAADCPSSAAAASVEHAHVPITAAEAAAAVEREQDPLHDDPMHGKDKRLIRLRSSSCIEHGEMLMRISQYDQEFAISGTSIEALRERKRVLAHLNREISKAPAEVLQRWEVDRHTRSGLNQFMKEWQEDPTWGTMVQTERRRSSTLKRFDRQVSWRTEAQLRTDFGDEEATGMMSHKKKSKDQVRKNPNNPTTLQYAVIVDESLRRAEVAEDTEWEGKMDHTGSDLAVTGEIATMMALTENINTWDDDEEEEEKKPETAGGPPGKKPRATPTKKEPRAKDEDGAPVFFAGSGMGQRGCESMLCIGSRNTLTPTHRCILAYTLPGHGPAHGRALGKTKPINKFVAPMFWGGSVQRPPMHNICSKSLWYEAQSWTPRASIHGCGRSPATVRLETCGELSWNTCTPSGWPRSYRRPLRRTKLLSRVL